jgi:DNA (cytosine-5)-methyltransferase 1
MEAMTRMPDYYVTAFCPIKSSKWLPQNRDRLIIFGSKKPFTWQEPNPKKRVTLLQIIEKNPEVTLPKAIAARMNGEYRDLPIISDPAKGDVAPTAVAHYAKDKSTRLLADKKFPMGVRPYSVREFARLQGVPDWFKFNCSATEAYRAIGNGVSIPVGKWIGTELKRYFN